MILSRRAFLNFSTSAAILTLESNVTQAVARATGERPETAPRSKPPAVVLPPGYRRPGDMKWGWGPGDDGVLPDWSGGSGTHFDPKLINWNADKSATLSLENDNGTWRSGELQVNRPKRPIKERWGGMLSSERPGAVCTLFAFASDGTEIDFEWRGDQVWQLNLHLFDAQGKRINPSPVPTVSVDIEKVHTYEFSIDDEACRWFIDNKEVAKVTPAEMPGAIWKPQAEFGLFTSVEHHGAWARHNYADLPATMTVHGLLA